jgi:hypothetical protein
MSPIWWATRMQLAELALTVARAALSAVDPSAERWLNEIAHHESLSLPLLSEQHGSTRKTCGPWLVSEMRVHGRD